MLKPRVLLIAEKPSVSHEIETVYKSFSNTYPYDIDFAHARGHLVALCDPSEYAPEWGTPWRPDVLPMIPEEWKTEVKAWDPFNVIKNLIMSNQYDYIINACDAGREGCLIFYRIYDILNLTIPVLRFWAEDLSAPTIKRELQNLHPANEFLGLRYASYLRAYLDWLIGMNFSRAASLCTKSMIAIGRVETPTLNMIVQREAEIEKFQPEDYFEIEGSFLTNKNETYHGMLYENGSIKRFTTLEESNNVCATILINQHATVVQVNSQDEQIKAPALHNLAELQKEAAKLYGYSPDKTLKLAQSLYEKKVLSYPRTDCRYLTQNLALEIPDRLTALAHLSSVQTYVKDILSDTAKIDAAMNNKAYVDDSKITDHHALIPTVTKFDISQFSKDEINIYNLVVRRFVGIFLPPNINSISTIITDAGGYMFQTKGKVLKQLGWKALYPTNNKDIELPDVVVAETVTIGGDLGRLTSAIASLPKQTQPPKRYTEATIIDAMETCGKLLDDTELRKVLKDCKGLGTSATRAAILLKLLEREWVRTEVSRGKGKAKILIPTEKGKALIKTLENSTVVSPELTATWEKRLKDLESNPSIKDALYQDITLYITNTTKDFLTNLKQVSYDKNKDKTVVGTCPDCGANVLVGQKAYYCQNVFVKEIINGVESKKCSFGFNKEICGATITESDAKALLTTGCTPEKTFTWQNGKKGKTSLVLGPKKIKQTMPDGTEKYVEISGHAVSFRDWNAPICKCPACDANIISGKTYYLCERYKNGCPGAKEGIIIPKEFFQASISIPDIVSLVQEGKQLSKKLTWNNGESTVKKIFWNQETMRIEYQRSNRQ